MPQSLKCAVLALVLLSPCLPLVAQLQPATPVANDARSITLNVITSPAGPASDSLSAQDFQLLDNKTPRPFTSFRRVTVTDPVHVIVVVDAINLPFTRVAYVRSEVQKFLKADGGHLALPTTFAVITDKTTEVQQGFSTDGAALSNALEQYPMALRQVRRDQGFWGADERTHLSLKALDELTAYAAKLPGRKLILWVSPGWPLLTGARIDLGDKQHKNIFREVVNYSGQLRQANITLYNINPLGPEENLMAATYYENFVKGVRKPSDTEIADLSLQVLAAQSGGLTLTSSSDVAGNIAKCIADTHSWFELTFTPPSSEHPDEYHHVQINIAKPGITARTRDGYYAQP